MNDLSLHIIDIIQNSVSAGATLISLTIEEDLKRDYLIISIKDNGKGMDQDQVKNLSDPFFTSRTTRRVGMGIPLFKQAAEQAGGSLDVHSQIGIGTEVIAVFVNSHIDRAPLGDVANSFILMVSANPNIDFEFKYKKDGAIYEFSTIEVKEILEDLPLNDPSVIRMLTSMIEENIKDL